MGERPRITRIARGQQTGPAQMIAYVAHSRHLSMWAMASFRHN